MNLISGPSTVKSINKLNPNEIDNDTILTMSFDDNFHAVIKTGAYLVGLYLATINIISGRNINSNDIQKIYFIRFYPKTNCLSIRI